MLYRGLWKSEWWILVPIFPVDLVIGAIGLFVGLIAFFFLPSLGLRGARKQAVLELNSANEYINNHEVQAQAN